MSRKLELTRFCKSLIVCLSILGLLSCSSQKEERHYRLKMDQVSLTSKFESDTWSHCGGSLVKGDDGLYHMFYSRWETDKGWAWVTDSEVAHAVSKSPFGSFEFKDVALPPRGAEFWDGLCTHNPTVRKFGDKYYIYYMGNTGDGMVPSAPGKESLNWVHRNNQRIGVAVADNPNGPWTRFDKPLIDITDGDDQAIDALMTSNPSITSRPGGGYLMVYKVVGKKFPAPNGGPVLHGIAASDSPTGPFLKHDKPTFEVKGERFPAEDPYIWYQDGKYRAVVKRIEHKKDEGTEITKRVFSLVQYDSQDGYDWKPSKNHFVSDRTLEWEDGRVVGYEHLERPQVFIENGVPVALVCAADTRDENNVRRSFNVQIPITFE